MICNCAGLGDAIMFTPALRRLKELYPQCSISFITKPANKDALVGLAYIDNVYAIERKKLTSRLSVIPSLVRQDYVVFTDWQPQLASVAKIFKVPHVSGITRPGHRSEKIFERHIKEWVLSTMNYAADTVSNGLSIALNVKIDSDTTNLDIAQPNKQAIENVDRLLQGIGEYVCLAPFTGVKEKNWPANHSTELIKLIEDTYKLPVVILGRDTDYPESVALGGINLVGKTSLVEITEIIKRAKILIAPDSGPIHVAAAVKTPSIGFFGKEPAERWAPKKHCKVLTLHMPCSPCGDEGARNCKTLKCNVGITPEMVYNQLANYL